MTKGSALARRLVALGAALACLVLIAPPASGGDCCAGGCDGVCCLLTERAGLGHHHDHGGGEPSWSPAPSISSAAPCGAACAASSYARHLVATGDAEGSPAPAAAGAPAAQPEPRRVPPRPAHTADPRGPPSLLSIVRA